MTHPSAAPRQAGIVCHVSSLPGRFGIGTMGAGARRFIDRLADAGFGVWQILPLNPPNKEGSPYQSRSCFAGNRLFIDFDEFAGLGFEPPESLDGDPARLDFTAVAEHRRGALDALTDWLWQADAAADLRAEAGAFFAASAWLDDFADFQLILGEGVAAGPWWTWPDPLRNREAEALAALRAAYPRRARAIRTEQFLFARQWQALKAHANARGVRIMGDIPIYVAANSADTWANPGAFQLDPSGAPAAVAGVPPDYFAADGQLWGNPLYDWAAMAAEGYPWWRERLRHAAAMFDLVRIDHFRGFSDYWSVPADAETAIAGHWEPGPGRALFDAVAPALGDFEIVAEDLGDIDDRVRQLRDDLGLPGMHVLQFSLNDDPENPHRLRNHRENGVAYLSTHDNPTTRAWLDGLDDGARGMLCARLEMPWETPNADLVAALVTRTFASSARLALICLQDAFGLGDAATMNRPGLPDGNWEWRLDPALDLKGALGRAATAARAAGRAA